MNGYRDGLERKEVSLPRANQKREDVMDRVAGPGSSYLDLTLKKFGSIKNRVRYRSTSQR